MCKELQTIHVNESTEWHLELIGHDKTCEEKKRGQCHCQGTKDKDKVKSKGVSAKQFEMDIKG